MTPVIPSSINNVLLISGTPFPTRKRVCLKRCNLLRNSTKLTLLSQKYILPLSKSLRLLPQSRSGFSLHHESRIHKISATGTDIAVEEAGSPVADEDSGGESESPSDAVGTSEASSVKPDANVTPAQRKRSRPARKSEMPLVKPEELVPGATFTGKIRSIQLFGAFVDFGAFTDGLVHVSRLSDSFVTDVGNVVSVGQEVKVRLVEANMETGRISLTMRESDDITKLQQRRDGPASNDRGRSPRKSTPRSNQRRDEIKKTSKFVKGQDLEGTVKNLTRSGSFISLPGGEEGFLPASEELDEGFGNIMGGSSLQVGQEVSVRVLRITRGQVTLTMKKEEDAGELDLKLTQGVVHAATNPFMLAFRKNKDIAEFLDEREKEAEAAEGSRIPQTSDEMKGKASQTETEVVEVQDQQASSSEKLDTAISVVDETVEDETSTEEADVESSIVEDASNDIANDKKDLESLASDSSEGIDGRIASDSSEGIDGAVQSIKEEEEVRPEILAPKKSDTSDQLAEDAPIVDEVKNDGESELLGQTADQEDVRSELLAPEESDTSYQLAEDAPAVGGVKNDGESDLLGQTVDQEEVRSEILAPEESDTSDQLAKDAPTVDGVKNDGKSDLLGQTADQEEVRSEILAPKESNTSYQLAEDAPAIDGVKNDGESDLLGQTVDQEEVRSEILAPEESDTSDQLAKDAPAVDGVKNDGESDLLGQTADQEEVRSEILAPKESDTSDQLAEDAHAVDGVKNGESQLPGQTVDQEEVRSGILSPEESDTFDQLVEDAPIVDGVKNDGESDLLGQIADQEEVRSKILAPEESDVSDQLAEDAPAIDGVKNDGENDLLGQTADQEEVRSEILAPEESDTSDQLAEDAPTVDGVKNDGESDLLGQTADQISSEIQASEEVSQIVNNNQSPESKVADSLQSVDSVAGRTKEKVEVSSEILSPEGGASATEVSTTDRFKSVGKSDLSGQISDPIMSESAICKEATESQIDVSVEKDELKTPSPNAGNETLSATRIDDEKVGINPDKNSSITGSNEELDVTKVQQSTTEESHVTEEVENEIDDTKAKGELENGTTADNDTPTALVEDEKVESVPEKNSSITNSNGQSSAASPSKNTIKAAISPALVKQLREETGAGMMDCKKALSETGGDLIKAQEFLRKKGLASADKKASRVTAEGRIGSYIHDSRIGVLIEVNCETDFVSRGDIFKELVDDLAMQVAACPQVQYLVTEDVPKEIVDKEREIEMQKEDLLSKPEQIRSKIVEGRIRKRLEELALLEQPYIKNDKLVVKDWVKQTIATIGENMKVKRFVRFNLGEGLERKSQDFAAEVAAQTAAKPVPSPGKEQPAAVEAKETVDKPVKATVSAALVKQLREETGAGMMDCKKALSETGGDLEKAQEYLRKKGLSTADKKSSRLAAEGRIGSYIHDSRIGVLIEVNCETDFVGRSEKFKELVDDLAMQVVACPQVRYVSVEEIPQSIVSKEKELEMQREDLLSKPESIRERIVEGRVSKRLGELALLEQPFIKDDSILVKDLVKQTVAALGENIKVRRFVRFTLGETNESVETENAV